VSANTNGDLPNHHAYTIFSSFIRKSSRVSH